MTVANQSIIGLKIGSNIKVSKQRSVAKIFSYTFLVGIMKFWNREMWQ